MNTIKITHLYLIKRSFVSVLFGLLLFFQAANSWAITTQSGYGTVLVYETCWDSYDYMAKAYADNVLIHAGMDAAGLLGIRVLFIIILRMAITPTGLIVLMIGGGSLANL